MSFYESPLFINLLLISIYVLLAATLGLTAWSMVHSLRQRDRKQSRGIFSGWIAWGVVALLVATLFLTCLTASTQPLMINGETFDNPFWLRVSDMLINSSLVLIVVAAICTLLGILGIGRKLKD